MLSFGSAAYLADKTLAGTFTANLETLPGAEADLRTMERRQSLHPSQKSGLTDVRSFATFQRVFMQSKLLQSLMRPDRLRRGVAIFLLAFAFFDLTIIDMFSPQLCGDEQVSLSLTGQVDSTEEVAGEAGAIKTHDSQPSQDSHQ
ncbi:MAG: hypothetical protein ACREBD_36960, partial [Blastocatellia bacterium]